ncbi:MAG: ArsR/SmtB family transcription factor, partial [Luteolibacter sp.]
PHSTVSSHVQVIRKAGLLESVSCGKWTYVRVDRTKLAWLRRLADRFPPPAESQEDQQRAQACVADRGGRCGPVPVFPSKRTCSKKL